MDFFEKPTCFFFQNFFGGNPIFLGCRKSLQSNTVTLFLIWWSPNFNNQITNFNKQKAPTSTTRRTLYKSYQHTLDFFKYQKVAVDRYIGYIPAMGFLVVRSAWIQSWGSRSAPQGSWATKMPTSIWSEKFAAKMLWKQRNNDRWLVKWSFSTIFSHIFHFFPVIFTWHFFATLLLSVAPAHIFTSKFYIAMKPRLHKMWKVHLSHGIVMNK